MSLKETLLVMFFLVAFGLILWNFSLWQHESAHKVIFKYADINSSIVFSSPLSAKTVPDLNSVGEDLSNLELAQANVEAFGYQVVPLLWLQNVFLFALVLVFVLHLRKKE